MLIGPGFLGSQSQQLTVRQADNAVRVIKRIVIA